MIEVTERYKETLNQMFFDVSVPTAFWKITCDWAVTSYVKYKLFYRCFALNFMSIFKVDILSWVFLDIKSLTKGKGLKHFCAQFWHFFSIRFHIRSIKAIRLIVHIYMCVKNRQLLKCLCQSVCTHCLVWSDIKVASTQYKVDKHGKY